MTEGQNDFAERLLEFNRRAEKLSRSTFLREMRENRRTFLLGGSPFRAVREGAPDHEKMQGFLLGLRLFLQDMDGISIRKVAEGYEAWPSVASLAPRVQKLREQLNTYLDGNTPLEIFGERISRRALLEAWLYGELAHATPKHMATLRRWRVEDDMRPIYQHEFENVIATVGKAVFALRSINEEALEALKVDG
jgi:hypothetical protein